MDKKYRYVVMWRSGHARHVTYYSSVRAIPLDEIFRRISKRSAFSTVSRILCFLPGNTTPVSVYDETDQLSFAL